MPVPVRSTRGTVRDPSAYLEPLDVHEEAPIDSRRDEAGAVPEAGREPGVSLPPAAVALPFPATLDEIERAAVHAMVALHAGNKSAAAAALGISRSRLYRILESAPAVPSSPYESRNEAERVLALLAGGDTVRAAAAAEDALTRAVGRGDALGQADALRVLGIVALASGRLDEARLRLGAALDGARRSHGALLEAESLEALAAAELAAGDEVRAALLRAEGERAFAALGIHAAGRQVRARMAAFAAASFTAGDSPG